MKIIPGKTISENILNELKNQISSMSKAPVLKIYYIGDNQESQKYIDIKTSNGRDVGIQVIVDAFAEDIDFDKLSEIIINDANDESIDGMIIQLPVKNARVKELFKLIPVSKDVDGLNPMSLGLLWQNDENVLVPATALAIIKALKYVSDDLSLGFEELLSGKDCLVITRSLIIGKPVSAILVNHDATVMIAHSKTNNIQDLILKSKIIISGTGIAGFLNQFNFSPNTIIIDAGFKIQEGKVYGDYIKEANSNENISYLSPVPYGIGPIGVACLLENTLKASNRK
jgi:methylenetetrahydrofolate dehydrogenase (NADP+)/methenyltetrahydrofolate cyclohydrolase